MNMGRMSTKEFMGKKYGGGGGMSGKFINLKEAKKITGWVHKDGFYSRIRHGLFAAPPEEETKDKPDFLQENCAGNACPLCALSEWSARQIDDGADKDEVVLSGVKTNDYDYTLEELAGQSSDWKKNPTKARETISFPFIQVEDARDPENLIQVVEGPSTLAQRVRDMIADKVERRGEKKGDPTQSPWAFSVKYDAKAQGKDMYTCIPVEAEDAPMDDASVSLFEGELSEQGIDMDKLTGDGDAEKILEFLQRSWVTRKVSFEEFETWYSGRVAKFKKGVKKEEKPEPAKKAKPEPRGCEPGEDEEESGKVKCEHCGEMATLSPSKNRCSECGKVNTKKTNNDEDVSY
jgi:ribosomal protein L37E